MRISMKIAVLAGLLALAGMTAGAQEKAEDIRPPVMNVHSETLANGLHVVMLEEHQVPVINLQVWYHVGSKDEHAANHRSDGRIF
jgi:ABC-type proline/glycine betaine transport system substrate-binding protein